MIFVTCGKENIIKFELNHLIIENKQYFTMSYQHKFSFNTISQKNCCSKRILYVLSSKQILKIRTFSQQDDSFIHKKPYQLELIFKTKEILTECFFLYKLYLIQQFAMKFYSKRDQPSIIYRVKAWEQENYLNSAFWLDKYLSSKTIAILLQTLNFMENKERKSNKPTTYSKITLEKRMKLIELINLQSLSISKASKIVSIKLSTAKLIIRRFMEEGTFFEKRSERLKRLGTLQEPLRIIDSDLSLEEQNVNQINSEASVAFEPAPSLNQCYIAGDYVYPMEANINGLLNYYWSGFSELGGMNLYNYYYV